MPLLESNNPYNKPRNCFVSGKTDDVPEFIHRFTTACLYMDYTLSVQFLKHHVPSRYTKRKANISNWRKKQQKRRDNTFFRTMKLHIKIIQSIIYSLHIVITHHQLHDIHLSPLAWRRHFKLYRLKLPNLRDVVT